MNKFCNVFLLNLIIFLGSHHFEALGLGLPPLDEIHFNAEQSSSKETNNLPQQNENNLLFKVQDDNPVPYDYSHYLGKLKPTLDTFSPESSQNYNPQRLKCPFRKNKGLPKVPFKWTDNWYNNCMKEVESKWRNYQDRRRRKVISGRGVPDFGTNFLSNYLDYTNSQMPFNEGKFRRKNSQSKLLQIPGSIREERKNDLFAEHLLDSVAEPKRFERSVRRRFEVPLKSQENVFEIPRDDPLLGYSRVRRFLDHERAKKRKRMPGTLEAKEAAMSRILDPNLNLDGILEPHVRKRRRGQRSKKRDLSFNPMYKKN